MPVSPAPGASPLSPPRSAAAVARQSFPSSPRWTPSALAAAAFLVPATAAAADVTVDPTNTLQRIDGFGASSAWTDGRMSDGDADLAFDPAKGVGLSLLRVRIAPDGSTLETVTAQKAQQRGARVWATPWSPPANFKTNDYVADGGALLPEHADDWAQTLVGFVRRMDDAGVKLYGVSAQNEPGYAASYESCMYDGGSLADFIGNHLGPAFDDAGLVDLNGQPLKIIAPETPGWTQLPAFQSAIASMPAAVSHLNTIASHSYNGSPSPDTTFAPDQMAYWETEVSDPNKALDPGMTSAIWVASQIHQAITLARVNAWHYWWIYPGGPDNSALWYVAGDGGPPQPAKRLFTMGNFSKFVRPGFRHVASTTNPTASVLTSAYYDAPSSRIVVVAINGGSTAPINFHFPNATTVSWSAWVTSPTQNLEAGDSIADSSDFAYSLPAQSVTTLVGTVTALTDAGAVVNNPATAGGGGGGVATDGGTTATPPEAPGCGLACSTAGHRTSDAGGVAGIAVGLLALLRRRRAVAA
jgi:glucuronoarabinoxylan endo-1,4-beta-xylanase